MTRRTLMQLPGAAALQGTAAAQTAGRTATPAGRPPNILFLMADQMTPFLTGIYGERAARMPNLDRLAASGVVFENAYCNSPLCVPSRMSMFSGRLAGEIDGWDNASEFRAEIPTFVHYLRRAGYHTSVTGKTHFIGPDQYHGFHERLTPCIYPTTFAFLHLWKEGIQWDQGTSIQRVLAHLAPAEVNDQIDYDSMAYEHALQQLRLYALGKDKPPFFLNVSFTQPHDPYCAPAAYLERFRNVEIPMPRPYGDIRKLSPTYEWARVLHGLDREEVPAEKVREARRNYMAMCAWIDDRVGSILSELRRLGLADNTLVVFASDHGDMAGEKGQWFKRLYLEWSARVPLILSWPGRLPAGRRVSPLVSLVDLFPTFCEAAGARIETAVAGRSLLPLADGREDGQEREVIGDYCGEATLEPIRMVRRGQFKYIAVNNYPAQLYDLKKDPYETVNAAGRSEYASVEKQLRARSEAGWDGPAVKRRVLAGQDDREMQREIRGYLNPNLWKPKPVELVR